MPTMTPPAWWPVDVPYTPTPPQTPYELLTAIRSTWPNSGDTNLMAAAQMGDQELLQWVASHNTGSPQWEQAARNYLSSTTLPTVDLQNLWRTAYNDEQARLAQVAQLAANPRTLIQSLLMGSNAGVAGALGGGGELAAPVNNARTSAQVGSWLQGTPMVQQAYQRAGLPGSFSAGSNPDFNYLAGRHISTQNMLGSSPSQQGLMQSMASFSGQNADDWLTDWERARPRGQTARATSFR